MGSEPVNPKNASRSHSSVTKMNGITCSIGLRACRGGCCCCCWSDADERQLPLPFLLPLPLPLVLPPLLLRLVTLITLTWPLSEVLPPPPEPPLLPPPEPLAVSLASPASTGPTRRRDMAQGRGDLEPGGRRPLLVTAAEAAAASTAGRWRWHRWASCQRRATDGKSREKVPHAFQPGAAEASRYIAI